MDDLPERFDAATRAWLTKRFDAPTDVQEQGWPLLASGRNALLVAPTGSGKTLAAFLAAIDLLGRLPEDAAPGVRVLYISPLKALGDYVYVHKCDWASARPVVESLRVDESLLAGVEDGQFAKLLDNYTSRRIRRFLEGLRKELGR